MNAYARKTLVHATSLKALAAEAKNDARYESAASESAEEARAKFWVDVVTFVRCVLGPIALALLLLSTIQWNPAGTGEAAAAQKAQTSKLARATSVFTSFHEQFAMPSQYAEDHIQAF